MDSVGSPMLLREIYQPLRLPKASVNRVLGRLHGKGVLTRYKIPCKPALTHGATRQCYLNAFAESIAA
ncbi:MAG: hypothetical protein ACKOUT_13285 [Novosphingobium sp.]